MLSKLVSADTIAQEFNGALERKYWRAIVGGSRTAPTVIFNSRSSMVVVTLHVQGGYFTVKFSKVACAFGDFMGATHRALFQILTALKACGMDYLVPQPPEGLLRCEYNPETKETAIHFAHTGDSWLEVEPMPFKVSLPAL